MKLLHLSCIQCMKCSSLHALWVTHASHTQKNMSHALLPTSGIVNGQSKFFMITSSANNSYLAHLPLLKETTKCPALKNELNKPIINRWMVWNLQVSQQCCAFFAKGPLRRYEPRIFQSKALVCEGTAMQKFNKNLNVLSSTKKHPEM